MFRPGIPGADPRSPRLIGLDLTWWYLFDREPCVRKRLAIDFGRKDDHELWHGIVEVPGVLADAAREGVAQDGNQLSDESAVGSTPLLAVRNRGLDTTDGLRIAREEAAVALDIELGLRRFDIWPELLRAVEGVIEHSQ